MGCWCSQKDTVHSHAPTKQDSKVIPAFVEAPQATAGHLQAARERDVTAIYTILRCATYATPLCTAISTLAVSVLRYVFFLQRLSRRTVSH